MFINEQNIIGGLSEVDASDISLKSFVPKNRLNKKLWHNGKIDSRARIALMDIADEFWDDTEITWVKPKDYIVTGSLANFNWSDESDIDLHILIDYRDVYENIDFIREFFDAKKDLWNDNHSGLKIFGFPVEIYVQDVNDADASTSKYSLYKNDWIEVPKKITKSDMHIDNDAVRNFSSTIMTRIDDLSEKFHKHKDAKKLEIIGKKAKRLFSQLKFLRKKSLSDEGEMSTGNIIWKVLRRHGYIDKLANLISASYDKDKSIV